MDQANNTTPHKQRQPGEFLFSCGLLLFSATALVLAANISGLSDISAPGVLPTIAASVMVLSGLFITREAWALPADQSTTFRASLTPVVVVNFMALGIAYIVLLGVFGFLIATLSYLFVAILYLHRQGWLLAFFVSLNSLAIIYVVFRVIFKVILPEGMLGL